MSFCIPNHATHKCTTKKANSIILSHLYPLIWLSPSLYVWWRTTMKGKFEVMFQRLADDGRDQHKIIKCSVAVEKCNRLGVKQKKIKSDEEQCSCPKHHWLHLNVTNHPRRHNGKYRWLTQATGNRARGGSDGIIEIIKLQSRKKRVFRGEGGRFSFLYLTWWLNFNQPSDISSWRLVPKQN